VTISKIEYLPATAPRLAPTIVSKLAPPPIRSTQLPRQRLLDRLDHGAQGLLTILSASAGYGKTTLLSTWIQYRSHCIAWVSLTKSDNEPTRFWLYIFAALQKQGVDLSAESLELSQSSQQHSAVFSLTMLLNDIARLAHNVVLVLDDYHVIDAPAIHQGMAFLLDHAPPQFHLVVASRIDPPWQLASLRARGQLSALRSTDLQFARDDVTALLADRLGLTLSTDELDIVMARTEGWAAGLRLAIQMSQAQISPSESIQAFSGSHRLVLDYVTHEVIHQQPEDIQHFLLHTALLDRLSGPLCAAITGYSDCQALLDGLERTNLFLVPLDNEPGWYRYQRCFAEALRTHLARMSPDLVADVHRRASDWYAAHGDSAGAVPHALAAGALVQAADLAAQCADDLWLRGEVLALRHWLDVLPDALVRERPALHRASVFTQLATSAASVIAWDAAPEQEIGTSSAPDAAALLDRNMVTQMLIATFHEATPFQQHQFHQRLISLPRPAPDGSPVAALDVSMAAWTQGDFATARRALNRAVHGDDLYVQIMAMCYLGEIANHEGQLPQASRHYTQALRLSDRIGTAAGLLAGLPRIGLAEVVYEWNDLSRARQLVDEGLALVAQSGRMDVQLVGLLTRARIQQAQGEAATASATMNEAIQVAEDTGLPRLIAFAAGQQADLWLRQGNVPAAVRWAQSSGLGVADELTFLREPEYLVFARMLLAIGAIADAQFLLARLHDRAAADARRGRQIAALLTQAVTYHVVGEHATALQATEQALGLAETGGYTRSFLDAGSVVSALIDQLCAPTAVLPAAQHARTVAYALRLRALCSSALDVPSAIGTNPTHEPTQTLQHGVHPVPPNQLNADGSPAFQKADQLTTREREVLNCIAAGMTTRAIAQQLSLSPSSVNWHIANLYSKLQVHNRTQSIVRGRMLGFLT
jgi:LuxR family transcriptional regulator, maltose regulon positive regulatory protein